MYVIIKHACQMLSSELAPTVLVGGRAAMETRRRILEGLILFVVGIPTLHSCLEHVIVFIYCSHGSAARTPHSLSHDLFLHMQEPDTFQPT